MEAALAKTLIDSGLNTGGSIIGGLANLATSSIANHQAYEQNLEMWNKNNEYNKPINQMARLREAGINPMISMSSGSISGNTVGNTPQMEPARGNFDLGKINAMAQYNEFKLNDIQRENLIKQGQLIDANIAKVNADTAKTTQMLPAVLEAMGIKNKNILSATAGLNWKNQFNNNIQGYLQESARIENQKYRVGIQKSLSEIAKNKAELGLYPWKKNLLKAQSRDKFWDASWNSQGLKNNQLGNDIRIIKSGLPSLQDLKDWFFSLPPFDPENKY